MSIQILRGTSSQRAKHTEVSLAGQPIYETDTRKLYIGNGTTQVNLLNPVDGEDLTFSSSFTRSNNTVSLNPATTSRIGGIKLGHTSGDTVGGRTAQLNVDSNNNGYVFLPVVTPTTDGIMTSEMYNTIDEIPDKYARISNIFDIAYNVTSTVFGASNRVIILRRGTTGYKILFCAGKTSSFNDGATVVWNISSTIRSYGFSGTNISVVGLQLYSNGLDQYRNGISISSYSSTTITLKNNTNNATSFNFIAIGIAS